MLFLIVLSIGLVSLGLPDTLLGSAWPVMQGEFGVPLDAEGIITMTVCLATIVSCLTNSFLVRKLGTAKIAALSALITALCILGYSQAPSFGWLVAISVPLGLGAGSIDTCLNNYGALFLNTRQLSWQHCCYGLGAAIGPFILSLILGSNSGWRMGYTTIGFIQLAIAAFLFLTLPVWKGRDYRGEESAEKTEQSPNASDKKVPLLKVPGVLVALIGYAVAFGIEYGVALWSPTYLVGIRHLTPDVAARMVSLYFLCIMVGRFIGGILSAKLSDRGLLRLGVGICILGCFLLAMPLPETAYYVSMILIGIGTAPIFTCMVHLTPERFGRENSLRIMGIQMAAAYVGTAFLTPCIGIVADGVSMMTIPWFLMGLVVAMICLSEWIDRIVRRHRRE